MLAVQQMTRRIIGCARESDCFAVAESACLKMLAHVANARAQSNEIPQRRKSRWNAAIDAAVESRGWTPVAIAWFSAGSPKAS